MAAYIIASYDIADKENYGKYLESVGEVVAKHKGELLVGDFDATALEGERRDVYVVLHFDSDEAARNWYDAIEYEPLKKLRIESTSNANLVLAKQAAAE